MYLFLRGIDFASFYDFSIEFWKHFYSVIFSVFHFISNILRLTYYTKVGGTHLMFDFFFHIKCSMMLQIKVSICKRFCININQICSK